MKGKAIPRSAIPAPSRSAWKIELAFGIRVFSQKESTLKTIMEICMRIHINFVQMVHID